MAGTVADLIDDREAFRKSGKGSVEVTFAFLSTAGDNFVASTSLKESDVMHFLGRNHELLVRATAAGRRLSKDNTTRSVVTFVLDAEGAEAQGGGALLRLRVPQDFDEIFTITRQGELLTGSAQKGNRVCALTLLKVPKRPPPKPPGK